MNADLIQRWLRLFQTCIRKKDYETAKTLFHKDAKGFGIGLGLSVGLENIYEFDWKDQWPEQINFTFDLNTLGIIDFEAASVVIVRWHSRGKLYGSMERSGNATFVLHIMELKKNSGIFCLHSHFSKS